MPIQRSALMKPGTASRSGMCSVSYQSWNSSSATSEKFIAAIKSPFAIAPSLAFREARLEQSIELVEPLRRAAVEGELLVGGATGGDALKGVPQRCVACAHLVDGEVALEIAAVRSEQLDAGLDIGAPRRGPDR